MDGSAKVLIPAPEDLFPDLGGLFDFHAHLYNFRGVTTGDNFLRFGIKSACIMPSWIDYPPVEPLYPFRPKTNDFIEPERYLKKLDDIGNYLKGWSGKIYIFLPLSFGLHFEEIEEYCIKYKAAGVKIHPLQGVPIVKKVFAPYMRVIRKHNLIVYVHTDWVPSTEYGKVKNLMNETFGRLTAMFPDVTFIMGHAGNNDSYLNIWKLIKKRPNVYAETSIAPTPQEIEKVIYKVGRERILFGSNFPFCYTATELFKIYKLRRVGKENKKAVLRFNAEALMKDAPFHEF